MRTQLESTLQDAGTDSTLKNPRGVLARDYLSPVSDKKAPHKSGDGNLSGTKTIFRILGLAFQARRHGAIRFSSITNLTQCANYPLPLASTQPSMIVEPCGLQRVVRSHRPRTRTWAALWRQASPKRRSARRFRALPTTVSLTAEALRSGLHEAKVHLQIFRSGHREEGLELSCRVQGEGG